MTHNSYNVCTVMSLGGGATEEDGELIAKLFGSVGKIWSADEKFFDAITGLRYDTLAQEKNHLITIHL